MSETKKPSAEPVDRPDNTAAWVADRKPATVARYLTKMERTITTLRATIERYENLIVKMSSSEAWHSSTWAEARAAREAILAAREQREKTDE